MSLHPHDNTPLLEKVTATEAATEKTAFPENTTAENSGPVPLLQLRDEAGRVVFEFGSHGVIAVFNPSTGRQAMCLGNSPSAEGEGGFVTVMDAKGEAVVEIDVSGRSGMVRLYQDDDEIIRLGEFNGYPAEGGGYPNHRSRGVRIVGPNREEAATLSTLLGGPNEASNGGGTLVLNTPGGELGVVANAPLDNDCYLMLHAKVKDAKGAFPYFTAKADRDGGALKIYQGPIGAGSDSIPFTVGLHPG